MRLTERRLDMIAFAKFIGETGYDPLEIMRLRTLVGKASSAGVRNCNFANADTQTQVDRAMERVENKAQTLGLCAYWPGLHAEFKDVKGFAVNIGHF